MTAYTLKLKPWKRRLTLKVDITGTVVVTAAKFVPKGEIDNFVAKYATWIEKRQQAAQKLLETYPPHSLEPNERQMHRERTQQFCEAAAQKYSPLLGVGNFTVKAVKQRSRWGSCSAAGRLRFNWRLSLAPQEVLEYVVIHELAHLKYMNHSRKFWDLVATVCPRHAEYRKWLRKEGQGLMLQFRD